ncbi:MAG TPA: ACP S-malonyltransferase [Ktedonobacterales bacterium]|nr:ACP S-malonyltransferase [Ktedonobacterales bacterium]
MSERIAFVFPGQGSQAVGMGADVYRAFPAAHRVYDLADHALGFSLSRLCFEGPEETLRETINTQPALVATSLALLAALQEAAGSVPTDTGEPALTAPLQPAFTAGHSVGEYAAVAAAGALGIEDALRLVRERGRLMHAEGTACPSGMAAVLGMDVATLEALCAEATEQSRAALDQNETHPGAGRVVVANDNAPGQIVISGARPALDRAMELARERGARRVVPLAVSGAFHSPVMSPAAQGLAHAVNAAPIRDAHVPVVANISAMPLTLAGDLRAELARQIESPVQWTRTVEYLAAQGITTFVEIGAGQVLAGLIKRIARGATTLSLGTAADVESVAAALRERMSS